MLYLTGTLRKLITGNPTSNRDSGTLRGKRQIWGGWARLRAVLYMGAMVASRFNPVIRDFCQRLLAACKPKNAALTACMRELLVMLKPRSLWSAERVRTQILVGRTPCLTFNTVA